MNHLVVTRVRSWAGTVISLGCFVDLCGWCLHLLRSPFTLQRAFWRLEEHLSTLL